jgi:hypothetical protein
MPRAVYANGPMAELQIKTYAVDFHFLQASGPEDCAA